MEETKVCEAYATYNDFHVTKRKLCLVKGRKVIKKLITINKINLPDDLINIIKDYLFLDKQTLFTKHNKKYLTSQIKHLDYKIFTNSYFNIQAWNIRTLPPPRGFVFMGAENCGKCGNYLYNEEKRLSQKILCTPECSNYYNHVLDHLHNNVIEEEEELAFYQRWDEEEEEEEEDWDW